MQDQQNDTFGVELEFIAIFEKHTFTNYLSESRIVEHMAHVTARDAIEVFVQKSGLRCDAHYEKDRSRVPYSGWIVDEDCSIDLTADERLEVPDGYLTEAVEIQTPVFRFGTADFARELKIVLNTLRKIESVFRCRFYTNKTTGLHVHVGSGRLNPLDFRTVQRLLQFMTAHERNFDMLHAVSRVVSPPCNIQGEKRLWPPVYSPLSFFHGCLDVEVVQKAPGTGSNTEDYEYNPFFWIARIEKASNYAQLTELIQLNIGSFTIGGHSCTINLENLVIEEHQTVEDAKWTVEFRQHTGSLDITEITSYVSLLFSVVHFCRIVDDATFVCLLLKGADLSFQLPDLLRSISVDNRVIQHYDSEALPSLGELPRTSDINPFGDPQLARRREFLSFEEQNDLEQAANADHVKVRDVVDEKFRSGYYGWNPVAGPLDLTLENVQNLLDVAFERVRHHGFHPENQVARYAVFEKLGAVYNALDAAIGLEDSRVVEELWNW